MCVPGAKYQDHNWEEVRKLLGELSLSVLGTDHPIFDDFLVDDPDVEVRLLEAYRDSMYTAIAPMYDRARGRKPAGDGGDTVASLAAALIAELKALGRNRFRAFLKAMR